MRAQKFGIEIAGAGHYLPERNMTNQELLALFPRLQMSAEQIYNLLGVQERRVAEPHMTCAEMLARAGTQALNAAGISAGEIDLIIACPVPPDAVTPPTAALVQHYLGGSPSCTGFDLNMACTGSIAAMDIACRFLETGAYRNVLIVAGTIMSRDNTVWTNPMHRFISEPSCREITLSGRIPCTVSSSATEQER